MAALRYLTVQDMLWIHRLVTGKVQRFDYARLEEGTFYQYAPGQSFDVAAQGARFLQGFAKQSPFPGGNEAAAFVGYVTFLRANGFDLDASDAQASNLPLADLGKRAEPWHGESHAAPTVRELVSEVMAEFPKTLGQLQGKVVSAA